MKQYFVLDENVIVLAQTLRDENGQDDPTCRDLLQAMLLNCHSLVLAYPSMWAKYGRQVSILGVYTEVMGILRSMLTDAAKDVKVPSDDASALRWTS